MLPRVLDVVVSLIALLILSPLLLSVIVILRLTGEGEVFYLQERVGLNGKCFKIFKFATMLKNSPMLGSGTVTISNDPRVLPVGRVLRKTKVNELPQFLNVFLGSMSMIGPRPVTEREFNAYNQKTRQMIMQMPPGLSGIGSIVFRDEESLMAQEREPREIYKELIAPYKGRLEAWFFERKDALVYLQLIFITALVVLKPRSTIVWRVYPDLPKPPEELRASLGYPE